MRKTDPQFPSFAFLWPALAAEATSEFAAAVANQFATLAIGPVAQASVPAPEWATSNTLRLELPTVRLRDFATAEGDVACLICAPYALHRATVVDFAARHSLVAALGEAGLKRLFVTDWRSATPEMRHFSIDTYLADLNVLVDELGGKVDLIGLCQGGWMALVYAARFPAKVRKLVLAAAPIDNAVGAFGISALARKIPASLFKELVEVGHGRIRGQHVLQFWNANALDREAIYRVLQPAVARDSDTFERLESCFRNWHAATVDLPGAYYLQVVEHLFKENRLVAGSFTALGRRVDLAAVKCPMFLLAAREDEVVAPEQIFAIEGLLGPRAGKIEKMIVPGSHLTLFMGRTVLTGTWPIIANWLAAS